ncbi:hypothetical protein ZWY2020_038025 [Hordeum vulgare]|nr:hypothetical protein ZWY2020_038025 [Hordeum vulgare]
MWIAAGGRRPEEYPPACINLYMPLLLTRHATNYLRVANGCLHWLMTPASFITTPSVAIVSFSVAEETFTCIRSPPFWVPGAPPTSRNWSSGEQLLEMDDQLCLVRNRMPHGSNTLEIWKLLDYSSGFHRGYSNLGPNLHLRPRMPKTEEHAFTVGNKNVGLSFNPLTREHVIVEIFYHQKDFESRQYDMSCAATLLLILDHGRILLNTGRKIGLYDPVEQTIENLYSLDQVPVASAHLKFLDMPSTSSGIV